MVLAENLTVSEIAGAWTFQPIALLLAALAGWAYFRQVHRVNQLTQTPWPAIRTASFGLGLILLVLLSCAAPGHFARSVYWVWVAQSLTLLLVVPVPLMCGQPIELLRITHPEGRLPRAVESRAGRWLSSPLVGPALVPLLCIATLFGPVPGWAAGTLPISWLVQLLLVLMGAAIVLPLICADDRASSVAVGAAVAVGVLELLIDAVPGIVLRLSTHPVSGFFDHRTSSVGAPFWLHDQQIGGGVLWCVAELLDLPFLVLIFRRWVRADAREAAAIDAVLDQRDGNTAQQPEGAVPNEIETARSDEPWFLTDPRLRDRLR